MAYLTTRSPSLAFGTYVSPRQAPRWRPSRLMGSYGLGMLGQGADWSGFISIIQSTVSKMPALAPMISAALAAAFGTTNPTASQITLQSANQFILALGGGPGSLTAGNPLMKLSGILGAYRDALYRTLAAYAANPPQLSAPAVPLTPITSLPPSSGATATGAPISISDPSVANTPVPPGFNKAQVFVDGNGNQWMFNSSAGVWQNATAAAASLATQQEQQQAAQIAAATGTSPGGGPSPILVGSPVVNPTLPNLPPTLPGAPLNVNVTTPGAVTSAYSDVLNWLTENTMISALPNWVVVAGIGLVVLKMSGKGKFL